MKVDKEFYIRVIMDIDVNELRVFMWFFCFLALLFPLTVALVLFVAKRKK